MRKTTDELMKVLLSKNDFNDFLAENNGEMITENLAAYLDRMLDVHDTKKNNVIQESGIERSYCYQLFRGAKENPSRDVLIAIAFSIGMDLAETQTMMRIAHAAMLYPRDKRDGIIIRALAQGTSLYECDQLLAQYNLATVGK